MKTTYPSKMTPSLWVGVLMLMATITGQAQNGTLDYATADADLKTAKATVTAYEEQNWDKLRTYLSDDATIFGLASFDSLNVDETLAYWAKGSETAIPTLNEQTWLGVSIPDGPRKGNWVYTWGVNTLKYPGGTSITFPYHLALKMSNNKVEEAYFYYDNMKIIREMGYAISPPLEDEDSESLEGLNIGN